jgi:DNA primase small subunit
MADFEWNVDSDSSNEIELWEEWDTIKGMLERERSEQGAVTSQWKRDHFYRTQFPLVLIEKLFGSEDGQTSNEIFESRNFAFILQNSTTGAPVVSQYQSFRTPLDLQDAFCARPPLRLEVGSRGFEPACMRKLVADKLRRRGDSDPHQMHTKELVFDVDLTDWNNLRICQCSAAEEHEICGRCGRSRDIDSKLTELHGYCECESEDGKLCTKCWCFAKSSMIIMNYLLTQRLGFREVMFVFSGSKGYHCWVLDDHIKYMTESQRCMIVNYFLPWTDPHRLKLKDELHASAMFGETELEFLDGIFTEIMLADGLFTLVHPKSIDIVAQLLDIETYEQPVQELFCLMIDSALMERWDSTQTWYKLRAFITAYLHADRVPVYLRRIYYAYMFPRIDAPVTTKVKHLTKIPYSLHQTTRLVSVPILPYELMSFDPITCPNVTEISAIQRNMLEVEGEVDFMRNALNSVYYCRRCHPEVAEESLSILNGTFDFCNPTKYVRCFLSWCYRNITKFRMFKNRDTLSSHSVKIHGPDTNLITENHSTIANWLQTLAMEQNHYNTQKYELLVLSFLFFLTDKQFIVTSIPESLRAKIAALNLTP